MKMYWRLGLAFMVGCVFTAVVFSKEMSTIEKVGTFWGIISTIGIGFLAGRESKQ